MLETVFIYGGLLLSILFFTYLNNKKIYNIIIITLFFLILGLRDFSVGADTNNYIGHFIEAQSITISIKQILTFEPGYIILNKLIGLITRNTHIFILIISSIMIYMFQKFVKEESDDISLSYFLFVTFGFYFHFFVLNRQIFAGLILLFSIKYTREKDFFRFLLYVVIATSFHKTAIIFISLYFFNFISINRKYVISIICVVLGNLLFLDKVINKVLNIVLLHIPRYSGYARFDLKAGHGLKLLILYFGIFLIVYWFKDMIDKKNLIYFHMMALAILIQSLAYYFSLLTRITNYFSIAIIIIIPNILKEIKDEKIRKYFLRGIIAFSCIYMLIILKQDKSEIVPYLFYFQ